LGSDQTSASHLLLTRARSRESAALIVDLADSGNVATKDFRLPLLPAIGWFWISLSATKCWSGADNRPVAVIAKIGTVAR